MRSSMTYRDPYREKGYPFARGERMHVKCPDPGCGWRTRRVWLDEGGFGLCNRCRFRGAPSMEPENHVIRLWWEAHRCARPKKGVR